MKSHVARVWNATAVAALCALAAGRLNGQVAGGGGATSGSVAGGIEGSFQMLKGIEEQPSWAVPYGREFWRGPATNGVKPGAERLPDAARPAGMDDVLERVSHAIQEDAQGLRSVVRAKTYTASFVADGLRLSLAPGRAPGHRAARSTEDLEFRTRSVTVGRQTLFDAADGSRAPCRKLALCNTAQTLLSEPAGLVEHVEARGNGLSVVWVLRRQAPDAEEVTVRTELKGATFAGATSAGFHYTDGAGGADVIVTRAVATDARGHRWHTVMNAGPDGVVFRLPPRCLQHAAQPLVIETRIEPTVAFSGSDPQPPRQPAVAPPPKADASAAEPLPISNQVEKFDAARVTAPLRSLPQPENHAAAPSSHDVVERAALMEMRDLLVRFHGLALNRLADGIPPDRDTIQAQARAWQYLADSREAKARRTFDSFQRHLERARELLEGCPASGAWDDARRLSLAIENFTILPFTRDGGSDANRLEQDIRTRLPVVYHELRARGAAHYAIFTTLREAAHDAGMFHYYVTASRATQAGCAADWAARLADYDAHSNEYSGARQPLFARNAAVARTIAELGRLADGYLERIRTGGDTGPSFRALEQGMNELCASVRGAPLSRCGDRTVAAQLAKLRLAHAELLDAKLDLSAYSSPAFNGAKVKTLLAGIEAKLQNACEEAHRQLNPPDEASWPALGIASREEAQDVVRGRRTLAGKFETWLRLVRDWSAAVALQPDNNFATLRFLTSFVRNKAEWDQLVASEVYPVTWQYPARSPGDLLATADFRPGAPVEVSVNTMLRDLQDVWTCYGEY